MSVEPHCSPDLKQTILFSDLACVSKTENLKDKHLLPFSHGENHKPVSKPPALPLLIGRD